jgi:perosamine synthetase
MFVQPFGNGTTAIYAALRALKCRDRSVILPANICPSVISAIYHTSNVPFFVDIERDRWGLDPELLARHVESAGAVIAVHLFGIPCYIDRIVAACRAKKVPVIEDCAQAEGASYQGQTVGTFGDIAVFSYGAGKIISIGGGGAATTSDEGLFRALKSEHERLPHASNEAAHSELSRKFKQLYNNQYPSMPGESRRQFDSLLREIASCLLSRHDPSRDNAIAQGRATLKSNISARFKKVRVYKNLLSGLPGVEFVGFPKGSAPWRCNLLLDFETRQTVLKRMLAAGANVSSWFPDMSDFLDPASFTSTSLTNSQWLDRRVVNLWVDSTTTDDDVNGTGARISAILA